MDRLTISRTRAARAAVARYAMAIPPGNNKRPEICGEKLAVPRANHKSRPLPDLWCIVSNAYADRRAEKGLSRHRHRQRRVWRHGRLEPDASGHSGPAPRCRGSLRSKEVLDACAAVAGAGARGARRASAAVLSRQDRAALLHA